MGGSENGRFAAARSMDLTHEIAVDIDRPPDFETVPDVQGVLRIQFVNGLPYLCRTARLRRRVKRLLGSMSGTGSVSGPPSRLAESVEQVSYQPTGSAFESSVLLYRLARRYRPDSYRGYLKLRPAPFIKVHLGNPYPRTYVTTKLTGRRALFFGPFVSRASADRFEEAFLDLFKIRRCQENLEPHPTHPGCIYGEMDMCLRPCQARSTPEEYRAETGKVLEFLETGGQSLVREIEDARERSSAALEFEEAAREHQRLEKVRSALKLKDELARDIDRLFGLVIQPAAPEQEADPAQSDPGQTDTEPAGMEQAVELWLIYKGFLQPSLRFPLSAPDGRPVSLDRRLRETLEQASTQTGHTQERSDHLALLSRWYQSSWRKGELVLFDGLDRVPYRRVVNAISRVASAVRS